MSAPNHLPLHPGSLSPHDVGDEDEEQRFHGLPPLKRFKMLQKEMKDLPPSPPMALHRPVQVCCLPAKKRVCALQFFTSITDEVSEEECRNKENEMETFKDYVSSERCENSFPSFDPVRRRDLVASNSTIANVRSSLAPLQFNTLTDSVSAQKNGGSSKQMIRASKKENKNEARNMHKSSRAMGEPSKKIQLNPNLVESSGTVKKNQKENPEKGNPKEADHEKGNANKAEHDVSLRNGHMKETKVARVVCNRGKASTACLIAKRDQDSFSRKRAESCSSKGSKETILKRGLIHDKGRSLAEVPERKGDQLKTTCLKRKDSQNLSTKQRIEIQPSEADDLHCLKKENALVKRDERPANARNRAKEELPKVSLKIKDDEDPSEKEKRREVQACLKKKKISAHKHERAKSCVKKEDAHDHQSGDVNSFVVKEDCLKLKENDGVDVQPCLKKKRMQLKGSDSSNFYAEVQDQLKVSDSLKAVDEGKGQFKAKGSSLLCMDKKGQFKGDDSFKVSRSEPNYQVKGNAPNLSVIENKEKLCLDRRNSFKASSMERNNEVKEYVANVCFMEKNDKLCSDGKEANQCLEQLKKLLPKEPCAVSVVKGHCSNSDKHHDGANVFSEQSSFTSHKILQNVHGSKDKNHDEVDDGDEEDDGVFCDVCKEEDADEEDPIVFCDGCDVMVHASCYGYPLIDCIPEGDWFCKQCIEKQTEKKTLSLATPMNFNGSDKSTGCCLCPKRGGVMKETTDGGWAHLSCALFVPEVFYRKAREREEIDCGQVPSWRWNLPCIFCKKNTTKDGNDASADGCGKGACIQCTEVGCTSTFHVSCAMDEGLSLDIRIGNGVSKTPAIVIAFCPNHTQQTLSVSERRRFKIVPRD